MFPEAFCHELLHQAEYEVGGLLASVYLCPGNIPEPLGTIGILCVKDYNSVYFSHFLGNQSINEILMKMSGKLLGRRSSSKFRVVLDFCYVSDWFCLWVCLCTTFVCGVHLTPWNHHVGAETQTGLSVVLSFRWRGWRMESMKQLDQHNRKKKLVHDISLNLKD